MHPRIDQFYRDADYGLIKFIGYKDGQYLFNTYDKPDIRWRERDGMLELSPTHFDAKMNQKLLIPSLPPE